MKVLHLVQQPQRRGAEMFAFDLTTELLERGFDVRTVYLYPAAANALEVREDDVLLDADATHPLEKVLGFQPKVVHQLGEIVADFQPDVVQANGARTLKYGAALKRVRGKKHPFAFVYRSIGDPLVWVQGRMRRMLYSRLIMPQVNGIAAVSSTSLAGLRQLYDLDDKTVAQIPRGIDSRRLAPRRSTSALRLELDVQESTPVAVYVGSLTPEKRPDRLARVFADVLTTLPNARLWVIGDGPERGELENLLVQLGIADKVYLAGASDDVGSFVAASNVMVLTSDTEGLPGVVLEAACLGVPTVTTDVGGVSDAVTHGETGLLVDVNDEADLAAQLTRLLSNEAEAFELGCSAKARFDTRYAIQPVADSYVRLYQDVH